MPAIPVCLLEPIWHEFAALLPVRPAVVPTHPLGCPRRRVPDRVVFEHVVAALVHGSGYERIVSPRCSDRTIRRRVREWVAAGLAQTLLGLALAQHDRLIGLEVSVLAVDGRITKPCGGEKAGRSPVDRGKQGLTRSTATDAEGVPLHLVSASANRHDAPLLAPTLHELRQLAPLPTDLTVHLDRGDDSRATRAPLDDLGFTGEFARTGCRRRSRPAAGGSSRGPTPNERLRQAAPLHRGARSGGGFLLVSRGRLCRHPAPHSARSRPISVAHAPDHPPAQVTPIAGRSWFGRCTFPLRVHGGAGTGKGGGCRFQYE